MASIGVLGSHYAGDFFLGIDIMVTSMMVNFLMMCITLVTIGTVNRSLADDITMISSIGLRKLIGSLGILILAGFLIIHTTKDLTADVSAWYFHSTYVWLLVMLIGSGIYFYKVNQMKSQGIKIRDIFKKLPEE